jgi:hypothetical protein
VEEFGVVGGQATKRERRNDVSQIRNRAEVPVRLRSGQTLRSMARRAKTARQKKPGHFGRDDRIKSSEVATDD